MRTKPPTWDLPGESPPPAKLPEPGPNGFEQRPVADRLVVNASVLGYGTIAVSAFGRDRIGFVRAICNQIAKVEPTLNIDGARVHLIEDVAFVDLLLRPRTSEPWSPAKHRTACEGLGALATEGFASEQMLFGRAAKMVVAGPDRPGVLLAIASVLADRHIGIRRLDGDVNIDTSSPSAGSVPVCRLVFQLDLPAKSPIDPDELTRAITGIDANFRCTVT
jgi:predicted amino acid-binding ACT domain protein